MWSLGVPMNSPDLEASKLVSHLMPDVQQGVSDFKFFSCFFLIFYFFSNNNEKCKFKSPHQELCNSPTIQIKISFFQMPKFFGSLLKKYMFCVFFQKWIKKIWQLKKLNCHPNRWTNSLLVMRRFSNYTKFHCSVFDRKCRKL